MNIDVAQWPPGLSSEAERIWSAAGPTLLLCSYFALGAVAYAGHHLLRGSFRSEEMDAPRGDGLSTTGLRHFSAWILRPWWMLLARVHFPANAISSLSVAVAVGAGIAVAAGRFALGGCLFVTVGALDVLEDCVARASGQVTRSRAAFDSILERYVESAFIVGLTWYYRQSWVLVVCLLALTGSLLVPYVRARGESLGVTVKDVGFMQPPERVLVLGAGTALSPIAEVIVEPNNPHPQHSLAVAALVLLAMLSHGTALQRLSSLLSTLDGRPKLSVTRPLKGLGASTLATAVDLAVATTILHWAGTQPSVATAAGYAVGAVFWISLRRARASAAVGASVPRLERHAFVSVCGAALNSGGVALLSTLDAPFLLACVLTRATVFATWSYPAQRGFVFVPPAARSMSLSSSNAPSPRAVTELESRPRMPDPQALGGQG